MIYIHMIHMLYLISISFHIYVPNMSLQQRCCLKLTWNKKKSANNDIGQWCETWPSCSNHFQFYFKDQYLLQPPRRAVGGSLAAIGQK